VRYVDDFVLVHQDPSWLTQAHRDLRAWLPEQLHVRLNDRKTIIQPVDRGVDFVGQVIKPWRRTIRRRTLAVAASRLARMPHEQLHQAGNSYFGLVTQATASHHDCARLANVLRGRGKAVRADLRKVYG
jgi:RNA-directed DNA polymerase